MPLQLTMAMAFTSDDGDGGYWFTVERGPQSSHVMRLVADLCGIQAGDEVVGINGQPTGPNAQAKRVLKEAAGRSTQVSRKSAREHGNG